MRIHVIDSGRGKGNANADLRSLFVFDPREPNVTCSC